MKDPGLWHMAGAYSLLPNLHPLQSSHAHPEYQRALSWTYIVTLEKPHSLSNTIPSSKDAYLGLTQMPPFT